MTAHLPARVARVWTLARRSAPTGRARGDWLVSQLPLGLVQDDFLVRFVRIFQDVATTYIDQLDGLIHQADPAVAPPAMVRYLGRWLGVNNIDPSLPDELQRRIVREWSQMLAWRGTRRGLEQLLTLMSGAPATVTDTAGVFREGETPTDAGRVVATVTSSGWVGEEALVELVKSEMPVGARVRLFIGDRMVWTTDTAAENTELRVSVASATVSLPRLPDPLDSNQGGQRDA